MGVFGVNTHTAIRDVTDGTSNVIMVAERRIFNATPLPPTNQTTFGSPLISQDGWAWGGSATLYSNRLPPNLAQHYDEAGALHDQIVQALYADGSVHQIPTNVDIYVWQNLGNMKQGSPLNADF